MNPETKYKSINCEYRVWFCQMPKQGLDCFFFMLLDRLKRARQERQKDRKEDGVH